MPTTLPDPDERDDDRDDEGPGEHDGAMLDEDEPAESDLVACPACGRMILAVAERCHRCGAAFDREAWLVERRTPWGVWVLAVGLVILALLGWLWA